jgi:hypothetical protein
MMTTTHSRTFEERRALVLEEKYTLREVQLKTPKMKGVQRNAPEEPFKALTSSPRAPKDFRNYQAYQEGIGDLGYVTIGVKLNQARAEIDPDKRGKILVEAQMLMTEYLNVGRDESLPPSVKEKIRSTLQDYLSTVKTLAPNYVDLPYVLGASGSPQESCRKLEALVKNDPALAELNSTWEARKQKI